MIYRENRDINNAKKKIVCFECIFISGSVYYHTTFVGVG